MAIPARYRGKCPACGDPIAPGDPVYQDEDGWRHEGCVEVTPTHGKPETVCSVCFLTSCDGH